MRKERTDMAVKSIRQNNGQLSWLPKNPRQWTQTDIDRTVKSIEEDTDFLEDRPVLLVPGPKEGQYIAFAGNLRYTAAKKLDLQTVPAVVYYPETDEDFLTVKRRAMKDNGTFGAWDMDELANNWSDLPLPDWGIDVPGMEDLPEDKAEETAEEDDFNPDEQDIPERCKPGDIWKLGNHRLMCGDSTDTDSVGKLMDGNKADVTFTSPPYNLGVSKMSKRAKAKNNGHAYRNNSDDLSDEDYRQFLGKLLANALAFSDDALFNIGILKGSKVGIVQMLNDFQDKFCDILVWNKSQSMPLAFPSHAGVVGHRCELIFCFNQDGSRAFSHPQWEHGKQINRIDTENATGNEFAKQHAATVPVALPAEVIKSYTKTSVLDLCGGTGTTMVAAEQLGRSCYMMEIDSHYCDIILARWEKLTGQTAELING